MEDGLIRLINHLNTEVTIWKKKVSEEENRKKDLMREFQNLKREIKHSETKIQSLLTQKNTLVDENKSLMDRLSSLKLSLELSNKQKDHLKDQINFKKEKQQQEIDVWSVNLKDLKEDLKISKERALEISKKVNFEDIPGTDKIFEIISLETEKFKILRDDNGRDENEWENMKIKLASYWSLYRFSKSFHEANKNKKDDNSTRSSEPVTGLNENCAIKVDSCAKEINDETETVGFGNQSDESFFRTDTWIGDSYSLNAPRAVSSLSDSQRQESLNKTISSLNQSPSFRKNCSFAMHDDKINDKFDCDEGNELSVMDEFKRNDRDAKNDFRFSFLSDDEKAGQKLINIERSGFGKPQSHSWDVPSGTFHSPKRDSSVNSRVQANTPRKQAPSKTINSKSNNRNDSPKIEDLKERRGLERLNSQSFSDSPMKIAKKHKGNRFDFTNLIKTCSPMQKRQRENVNAADMDVTLKLCEKISSPLNNRKNIASEGKFNSLNDVEERKESLSLNFLAKFKYL